jgi:hypothetical protein
MRGGRLSDATRAAQLLSMGCMMERLANNWAAKVSTP